MRRRELRVDVKFSVTDYNNLYAEVEVMSPCPLVFHDTDVRPDDIQKVSITYSDVKEFEKDLRDASRMYGEWTREKGRLSDIAESMSGVYLVAPAQVDEDICMATVRGDRFTDDNAAIHFIRDAGNED